LIDGEEKSLDAILGDSLCDAYDAAEALPEGGDAAQGDVASAAPAAADGRQRDEQGRFAPKTDTGQAAEPAPAITNTDQGSKPGDGAAPAAVAAAPSDAPVSWSAAEKAHWKTLPPGVQQAIARREAEFSAGIEQKTQGYAQLETVIGPRRQALQATYGSEANALNVLFKLSDFADAKPIEFAAQFLRQRGIDPKTVFAGAPAGDGGAPQPGQGDTPSPAPDAAIDARLREMEGRFERRYVEMVNAPVIAKAQTDLQKFESEAATKYPHYTNPQIKSGMAQLLKSLPPDQDMTYEQAYDRVVWSFPEIRQQLIDAETKAAIEKQSKESADAARRARSTAGPQLRSVGTPGEVRAAPRSIADTLSETYDRAMGA
jgi:hypothetical protein